MARPIQIAPSVLPADFSKLGDAIVALDHAGVDLIQWDVMDGQFVPNLTFGPDVIASTRHLTKVPFEAHLMVLTPDVMARNDVQAPRWSRCSSQRTARTRNRGSQIVTCGEGPDALR
ncbi:MAG: hypothetical protein EBY93_04280 [Actinobacteria bacterium]|nr:hypothetical protein [Actinomycetota bacterium]